MVGARKQGAAFGYTRVPATTRWPPHARTGEIHARWAARRLGILVKHDVCALDRADWEFSVGLRPQPAVRAAIDTVDENAWMTLDDGPADVDRAIAETTLNGRRLVVGGLRSLDCRGVLPPS